jgi:hypothetical protein
MLSRDLKSEPPAAAWATTQSAEKQRFQIPIPLRGQARHLSLGLRSFARIFVFTV